MIKIEVEKIAGGDEEESDEARHKNVGKALRVMFDALQAGDDEKAGEAYCLACELERGY